MFRRTFRVLVPVTVASVVALFAAGCGGGSDSSEPPAPPAVPADNGAPGAVSLQGNWTFSEDANQNDPTPFMSVLNDSSNTVSVTYDGNDGSKCDCNSEHLVIPLGRTIDCSKGTIELDYSAEGTFGYTSTASLSIRFCKNGKCDESGFYGGDQFLGSTQTGHSNCAMPWQNEFPASPQLVNGHNKIVLGKLQSSRSGQCSGSFDTIDVHLQGYACFKGKDNATATLSNLHVY